MSDNEEVEEYDDRCDQERQNVERDRAASGRDSELRANKLPALNDATRHTAVASRRNPSGLAL
ncbi:hypothetical protein JZ751_021279 [Albula glossodonta]|uniref:Uncharacterized protein n=1 Tax=Albula glossodonta TaxID=121402 RepID=A0A8T2MZY1_9TELE|nr:hypothetical protein JZ751_021279 [Albula glossodonta]